MPKQSVVTQICDFFLLISNLATAWSLYPHAQRANWRAPRPATARATAGGWVVAPVIARFAQIDDREPLWEPRCNHGSFCCDMRFIIPLRCDL